MKTIYITLIFAFNLTFMQGQTIQVLPLESFYENDILILDNVYYKDINNLLDKFKGIWEYNDGTHYFKITFYRQNNHRNTPVGYPRTLYEDRIIGRYQYKLNGQEIYSETSEFPVLSSSGAYNNINSFSVFYEEPTTHPCGRAIIGKVVLNYSNSGGTEQLLWNRNREISGATSCYPWDDTPLKTPINMVLTKVGETVGDLPIFNIGDD
mgnify:CR=1 FL=1